MFFVPTVRLGPPSLRPLDQLFERRLSSELLSNGLYRLTWSNCQSAKFASEKTASTRKSRCRLPRNRRSPYVKGNDLLADKLECSHAKTTCFSVTRMTSKACQTPPARRRGVLQTHHRFGTNPVIIVGSGYLLQGNCDTFLEKGRCQEHAK